MKTPPTAMLGAIYGDGSPLLVDGNVDPDVLAVFKTHDYAICYPPGPNPLNTVALETMRAAGIKLVAKVSLSYLWPEKNGTTFTGALYISAERMGALVREANGQLRIDLTVAGMVEEVVRLIRLHIITPALQGQGLPWIGLHIEGPPSQELWTKLYDTVPLDWFLWWNGGAPAIEKWVTRLRCGTMWENWPFQGGTRGDPAGAFTPVYEMYRREIYDTPILFAASQRVSEPGLVDRQKLDYVIGCAALFDGIAIFAGPEPNEVPWWTWNLPTYDLGSPGGEFYKEHGLWRRDFDLGSVIVDPTYPANIGNPPARGRAWVVACDFVALALPPSTSSTSSEVIP